MWQARSHHYTNATHATDECRTAATLCRAPHTSNTPPPHTSLESFPYYVTLTLTHPHAPTNSSLTGRPSSRADLPLHSSTRLHGGHPASTSQTGIARVWVTSRYKQSRSFYLLYPSLLLSLPISFLHPIPIYHLLPHPLLSTSYTHHSPPTPLLFLAVTLFLHSLPITPILSTISTHHSLFSTSYTHLPPPFRTSYTDHSHPHPYTYTYATLPPNTSLNTLLTRTDTSTPASTHFFTYFFAVVQRA